jgi:hypothetical protein
MTARSGNASVVNGVMTYAATTEVCASIWESAEDLTARALIGGVIAAY